MSFLSRKFQADAPSVDAIRENRRRALCVNEDNVTSSCCPRKDIGPEDLAKVD